MYNEIYIIFGKIFIFLLILAGWTLTSYLTGLFLLHRKYLKEKIAKFLLKNFYNEHI